MRVLVLPRKRVLIFSLILFIMAFAVYRFAGTVPSLRRMPGTFYMVNTDDKVIALTFDDGPDPAFTGLILDELENQQVKATFFVLGQAASQHPELLKRMILSGHEIGNHGFSHDYSQRRLGEEITRTDQVVFAATQVHTKFYRPPGGKVSRQQIESIEMYGHQVALWSLDSRDWLNPGPDRIVNTVVKHSFPGSIVLLHDGGDKRGQTVKALGPIINGLKASGYRFLTLSELKSYTGDGHTLPTIK